MGVGNLLVHDLWAVPAHLDSTVVEHLSVERQAVVELRGSQRPGVEVPVCPRIPADGAHQGPGTGVQDRCPEQKGGCCDGDALHDWVDSSTGISQIQLGTRVVG